MVRSDLSWPKSFLAIGSTHRRGGGTPCALSLGVQGNMSLGVQGNRPEILCIQPRRIAFCRGSWKGMRVDPWRHRQVRVGRVEAPSPECTKLESEDRALPTMMQTVRAGSDPSSKSLMALLNGRMARE